MKEVIVLELADNFLFQFNFPSPQKCLLMEWVDEFQNNDEKESIAQGRQCKSFLLVSLKKIINYF